MTSFESINLNDYEKLVDNAWTATLPSTKTQPTALPGN